jgi:hypothetical protein
MLEREFELWLGSAGILSADTYISCLRNVEEVEGDLDEAYDNDRCAALLEKYVYTKTDQRNKRQPKHGISITPQSQEQDIYNSYYKSTGDYKCRINKYVEFRNMLGTSMGKSSKIFSAKEVSNKELTLDILGGTKNIHTVPDSRLKYFELNNGDNIIVKYSKELDGNHLFYGISKRIIDTVDIIDYIVFVTETGFFKFTFGFIKGLCQNGYFSLANKEPIDYKFDIRLIDNTFFFLNKSGKEPKGINEYYIKFNDSISSKKERKQSNAAFLRWFEPIITALKDLGGTAKPEEVRAKIIANMNLSFDIVNETRGKTAVRKFDNEVAFARNYLVYEEIIDGSIRGVWSLTDKGKNITMTSELASDIFNKWLNISKSRRESVTGTKSNMQVSKKRYWLFTLSEKAQSWEYFHDERIIGVAWDELGDLSQYTSKAEICIALQEINNDKKLYKNLSLVLWQFANNISVGDIIFVKSGASACVCQEGK